MLPRLSRPHPSSSIPPLQLCKHTAKTSIQANKLATHPVCVCAPKTTTNMLGIPQNSERGGGVGGGGRELGSKDSSCHIATFVMTISREETASTALPFRLNGYEFGLSDNPVVNWLKSIKYI